MESFQNIEQFHVRKTTSPLLSIITGFIFVLSMLYTESARTDEPDVVPDDSSNEAVCENNGESKESCSQKQKSLKPKTGDKFEILEGIKGGSSSTKPFERRIDQSSGDCEKYRTLMNLRARIIYGCYAKEQIGNPNLESGKLTIKVSIDETGKVIEALIVYNSIQDCGAMEDCIINSISNWKFPKPENACSLTHSFIITRH